jgi:hypothetical protein
MGIIPLQNVDLAVKEARRLSSSDCADSSSGQNGSTISRCSMRRAIPLWDIAVGDGLSVGSTAVSVRG